jgi:hypothetical protein
VSLDVRLPWNSHSSTGSIRKSPAPLTRWRIDRIPGKGNLIVGKSKFFGRLFLIAISAMNVIPHV